MKLNILINLLASWDVSCTCVTAPVWPQGEKLQDGGVEFVAEILEPDPAQNQPNTRLGWSRGSV